MKILAILNPKSGLSSSKAQFIDVLEVFSKHKHDVEVYITQRKNDAYEYILKSKKKYDSICVFGGDGTMNEVTNALMHKKNKPSIGYFPSGTTNDFGSNFNLGTDWKKIAEKVCRGKTTEFDVGDFNGKYFNYVAAFGAFCDVPYSTPREIKKSLGYIAYFIEGIKKIIDIRPIKVNVKCNDKQESFDALFGLIFSGNRVAGMELLDKKKGKINDGKFNVLIVEYARTLLDAPNVIEILTSQHKYLHWYSSEEIEIDFDGDVKFDLDGEEASVKDKLLVKNINKALKILN